MTDSGCASGHPIPAVAVPRAVAQHWLWHDVLAPYLRRVPPDDPAPDGRITNGVDPPPDAPAISLAALAHPPTRDAFLSAVFANRRLRAARIERQADLQALHAREKYLIMAHAPETYRRVGKLIAGPAEAPLSALAERYCQAVWGGLLVPARRGRHASALEHMAGYFKRGLPEPARARMHAAIADFRAGLAPLTDPLARIRGAAATTGMVYIAQQTYLAPYPIPLMLRTWL
ncbi:Uncharacterized conserved protein YbgA, DUF1722 family [Limimonas halophila]|uniref:Uncharacterized conserved protein YbgA, DUF1722 family n=1 Tax=Limimonas halophila TaxID=1082479 RepID=A0A1G7NJ65_9PROT|nr:YbgA family protein [Limimonas halophila]SDF74108.1 Uncharacterized conserved protein YbgA, DUF1722 family [Limimonas halophila]